jgi:hypothetical protein
MRDPEDRSTPRPSNAFTPEFLDQLDQQDEPLTAAEADVAGPWLVEPMPGAGWALFRRGESLAAGDPPVAVFRERERALLVAAVLPGTGLDRRFRLHNEVGPEGFAVLSQGEVVGHLQHYNPELVTALNTAEAVVRLPECLAQLLEASGGVALSRAGRLLVGG